METYKWNIFLVIAVGINEKPITETLWLTMMEIAGVKNKKK